MAISYPLNTPTSIGIENISLRQVNAVSVSQSPFSYKQQVYQYSGQRWEADVVVATSLREHAEPWVAFLSALQGQKGTFYLGDPLGETPRGVATGTPLVDGSGQAGQDYLDIKGASPSVTGWLLAGDYIQVSDSLYKVLEDVDTESNGTASFNVWPKVRTSAVDETSVVTQSAKGLFRLSSNVNQWSINSSNAYGVSFSAVEALP